MSRSPSTRVFVVISLLVWMATIAAAQESERPKDDGSIRGITLSTHGIGLEWAGDSIVPTLEAIKEVGANWIAIHPYARIQADGGVRTRYGDSEEGLAHITRPIKEAHRLGLKICVKPHLAYWGSPFGWRGDIKFDDEKKWSRFFEEYGRWIVTMAKASRDADGFAVGTELDQTLEHEAEWREVIQAVRAVCDVPLTFASNWCDYHRVPFWDALDVIGIQAYFPLSKTTDPGIDRLEAAWRDHMKTLREFSEKHDRPIVFTELGYSESHNAPVEPWAFDVDGEEARTIKGQCYEAALQAIERESCVIGSFLWKWFPHPRPNGRNFKLATPQMKSLLREAWIMGR